MRDAALFCVFLVCLALPIWCPLSVILSFVIAAVMVARGG
jgi:hypothetical protein